MASIDKEKSSNFDGDVENHKVYQMAAVQDRDNQLTEQPNSPDLGLHREAVDESAGEETRVAPAQGILSYSKSQQEAGSIKDTDLDEEEDIDGKDALLESLKSSKKTLVPKSESIDQAERDHFVADLYSFMEKKGQPITKKPSLGFQELDLYKLYQIVTAKGGMDEVTRLQAWKSVYIELGIPTMSTSASYNTRTNYKKHLYLYELEHFEPQDKGRKAEVSFLFSVNQYIKIESTIQGQVYYAQILKRRYEQGSGNTYYVHYNSWSNSHDEWMPEYAISPLNALELVSPESLPNPHPTRSSKSNYLIYDPVMTPNTRQNSPRKKTHKSSSSLGRLSADEWNTAGASSVEENARSPGKIKFKYSPEMVTSISEKAKDASPFPSKKRRHVVGLGLQEGFYSESDDELAMQPATVPFTPKKSSRSSVPLERQPPSFNSRASPPHHPRDDLDSPAYREKERYERTKFNQIPLKPDPPAISIDHLHTAVLESELPYLDLLDGIDFLATMNALNEEARALSEGSTHESEETKTRKTQHMSVSSTAQVNHSDQSGLKELQMLQASIASIEKRMEEIRREYAHCQGLLDKIKSKS